MFNYGHVYFYLIESISNLYIDGRTNTNFNDTDCIDINDNVAAKPLKKGRSLLNSGFIENIKTIIHFVLLFFYYLRVHVHHSMKSDIPLKVTVTISGHVKRCTCNCKANALGRCAHISCVLLMISDYVSLNGYIINVPSTSLYGTRVRKVQKILKLSTKFFINQIKEKMQINYTNGIHAEKNIEMLYEVNYIMHLLKTFIATVVVIMNFQCGRLF